VPALCERERGRDRGNGGAPPSASSWWIEAPAGVAESAGARSNSSRIRRSARPVRPESSGCACSSELGAPHSSSILDPFFGHQRPVALRPEDDRNGRRQFTTAAPRRTSHAHTRPNPLPRHTSRKRTPDRETPLSLQPATRFRQPPPGWGASSLPDVLSQHISAQTTTPGRESPPVEPASQHISAQTTAPGRESPAS
jgi:hypothetical protein